MSLAGDGVLLAPGPAPGHGLAAELAGGGDVGHQGHGPHPHVPRLPRGRDAHIAASAGVGPVLDADPPAVVHGLGEGGQRDGCGLSVDAGGAARGVEARHQVGGGGA